jgi:hypothetical protein
VNVGLHDNMVQQFYVKQLLELNLLCGCSKHLIGIMLCLFVCHNKKNRTSSIFNSFQVLYGKNM